MENLTIAKLASAMARHAAARHRVLAENVANADTPGFRSRDAEPFSAAVNGGFRLRLTRADHLGPRGVATGGVRLVEDPGGAPNGNSVNLEREAMRAVETQGAHALALAVYAKTADILRIGLGRNR